MRFFYIILFSLLPAMAMAQQKIFFGFSAGMISGAVQTGKLSQGGSMDMSSDGDYAGNIKVGIENKHWQFGIAAETGVLHVAALYPVEGRNAAGVIDTFFLKHDRAVLTPFVLPNVFAHYKLNLPRGGYLYGGGMVGAIVGRTDLCVNPDVQSLAGGLQAGISLMLNKYVQFQVMHGWRITKVNFRNGGAFVQRPAADGSYARYALSGFGLQTFYNSIGLIASF